MGTAILFSKIEAAAAEFPEFIRELQHFFAESHLITGSSVAIEELVQRVGQDDRFREHLVSTIEVLCSQVPGISYLEVLGTLLAAAAGEGGAAELAYLPEVEEPVCELFRFVVEARPSRPERGQSALEVTAPASTFEESAPHQSASAREWVEPVAAVMVEEATPSEQVVYGSRLARALAVAEDHPPGMQESPRIALDSPAIAVEFPLIAVEPFEAVQEPARIELVPVAHAPEDRPDRMDPARERETTYPRVAMWAAGVGGLLLGASLEFFLQRHPAVRPAVRAPVLAAQVAQTKEGSSSAEPPTLTAKPVTPLSAVQSPVKVPEKGAAVPPKPSQAPGEAAAVASPVAAARGLATPEPAPTSRVDGQAQAAVAEVPSARVVMASGGIMAGNLISSPVPVYPPQASAAGVQGEVVVAAVVGRNGSVIESRIVSGPPLLRDVARNAVQHWRYRPFEIGGKPVEIITTARVQFRLDGN